MNTLTFSATDERTVALAGIIQACQEVQSLARSGQANQAVFDSSMQSILILDAVNVSAVFGGLNGVRSGLSLLKQGIMTSPSFEHLEVLRYAMSLMQLQQQLYRDQQRFAEFGSEIEKLSGINADQQIDYCSTIYKNFISNMRPQIIVQGEQDFLQEETIPAQVRALLLAGIRSAVLWQQKGGNKLKLIWERNKMRQSAARLIDASVSH